MHRGDVGNDDFAACKWSYPPHNNIIREIVSETADKIRDTQLKNSTIMANYVTKYFNMLAQHIESLKDILSTEAKLGYVIGNSVLLKVEVPADLFLAEIFEFYGFSCDKIVRIRRRNSNKKLYESIVYTSLG